MPLLYKLHEYDSPAAYWAAQIAGNEKKRDLVWVHQQNVEFLAQYILRNSRRRPRFGLCHGTRRGKEQAWFREALDCKVIGTEIAESAEEFPHTIQWDFHNVKTEWLGRADFIYSNSFDHTHDPELCINAWMSCIRPGGVCIIEHTSRHEESREMDPFGASIHVMPYLILEWGKGKFCVQEILDAPANPAGLQYIKYLIIRNLPTRTPR